MAADSFVAMVRDASAARSLTMRRRSAPGRSPNPKKRGAVADAGDRAGVSRLPSRPQALQDLTRPRRAVDALEPSGAIERVQLAPGPQRARPQQRLDALFEAVVVEAGDLGQAERRAVAVAAVLERPDQLAVAADDAAGGPRGREIDQHRIAPMRGPRPEQVGRRPDVQRIGMASAV